MADRPELVLAGIDGCRAGWIAAIRDVGGDLRLATFRHFAAIVDAMPESAVLAVDMPIGLPDRTGHGGRGPEALLRRQLGMRQSSLFSIPSRRALYASEAMDESGPGRLEAHREASRIARETSDPPRSVSIQAFGLFPKIREIDRLLRQRPELTLRIIESHPEAAFAALNGGVPMSLPKKIRGRVNEDGMRERRSLLSAHGLLPLLHTPLPPGVGDDDRLDACAMLVVASRRAAGSAISHPSPPGVDGLGIPVAIWT